MMPLVTTDLTCVSCGYLLRGQAPDDRCPECGGTVRLSIDAQRLGTWPAPWIARLRFGLRLLVAAVAVGWLAVLAYSLTSLSLQAATIPALRQFESWRLGRYEWILALPFLAAFILAVCGTVVVTFSEAARLVGSERPRAPWLARAGVAAGVLAFLVVTAAMIFTRGLLRDRLVWAWVALFVGSSVAIWNLCTCLARLAWRIADERLARRCDSFRWLALLVAVLACFEAFNFFAVLSWLPIRTTRGWWRALALSDTLILTGRVALLVAGIVAVHLLRRYANRLHGLGRNTHSAGAR